MKRRLLYLPLVFFLLLQMANCAKKGSPSGGPRDTIPPVIVRSVPDNYTTNFEGTEIRVYFDEYIKLKDLRQNLIISPPMEYDPVITPVSTSRQLRIRILDTLQPNTTYSLNFGRSIVDNNEENPFDYFKYVFSTGDYIDSLKVRGKVSDALLPVAEFPVTVMLYRAGDSFNDSLVYQEKPTYITTTRDSSNTFELTNVKEGKYLLLALKEETSDYIFQPATDKIGFLEELIELPADSSYQLTIFREELPYEPGRGAHLGKFRVSVGFEGDASQMELRPLSQVPRDFESRTIRDREKDSLFYWFRPEITTDTLLLLAENRGRLDSIAVRIRDLYADSLQVSAYSTGTLLPVDTVKIRANTPIISLDQEKVSVMDKDSVLVPATLSMDTDYNIVSILFGLEEEQRYDIRLLPGALTDFYEQENDSLKYKVQTKAASDYGTLSLQLDGNIDYPVIVQLVNEKYEVQKEVVLEEARSVDLYYIQPGNYFVRIIVDQNANGRWDPGDFLSRKPAEDVIYYPTRLEVRANWSLNERFRLD